LLSSWQRIDERGAPEGIAAVALKGAALHAIGLYAIGERPMADIDLPGATGGCGAHRAVDRIAGLSRSLRQLERAGIHSDR